MFHQGKSSTFQEFTLSGTQQVSVPVPSGTVDISIHEPSRFQDCTVFKAEEHNYDLTRTGGLTPPGLARLVPLARRSASAGGWPAGAGAAL
eukprot:13681578-Alexandrium_andersonii.AAC.1